jgi:type I restriction enzyme S subunit
MSVNYSGEQMDELTTGWKKVKLGGVAEFTNGGAWNSREYADSGIPIVQVTNISNNTIALDQCKYLSLESLTKYKKHMLFEEDLIIATVGSHPTQPNSVVGRVAIIPKFAQGSLLNQNAVRLSPKSKDLDKKYLGHLGKSPFFRNYIIAHARGSANQVRMSIGLLKEMDVYLPSLPIQRKIASILSTYDNLIENNTRRIEILEQMAKLVYEEWFVKFRFPGHEYEKIIDGVPEGWKKTNALEIMDVLSGGTPKTSVPDFWDGGIPFFTPKDSTDTPYVLETEKNISEQGLSKCSSKLYPKDTIFITARGTVGKLNLAQVPMAMNQSCYALVGKEPLTQYFLYCALHATIDQFKSRAVGAVFDAIIRDTFKAIPFVIPSKNLINDFTETVASSFKQIDNLIMQNRNLKETRDLLLPKLISGEIDVSDLDIHIRNELLES